MKKTLLLFTYLILSASSSCTNNGGEKIKINDLNKEKTETKSKESGEKKSTCLDILNGGFQDIYLIQRGSKCGEWGGDKEQIRIYRSDSNGKTFADYKKKIMDCDDPYAKKNKAKLIEKNKIEISRNTLKVIQECIIQLSIRKLSTKQRIPYGGIANYVISKDSTLIIEDNPSFGWPKFQKLTKIIKNK